MDLRERRELDNGIGDAFSRAFELVLTPAVFGFFGYLLDGRLGTRPLFMFVFFVFVLGYILWKQFVLYSKAMDEEQRKLLGPKDADR
jgi:F0F1-type ATP synthase assembly protein I